MPPYGEPDWATPGGATSSVTAAPAIPMGSTNTSSGTNINTAAVSNKARCILLVLSGLNIGLSAMMGTLGILSLLAYKPSSVDDLTLVFLSCYMIIFATLLFLYEFIWYQPVPSLNIMFRKNFGFLYGLKGKGFYLIFIAFLTLGLLNDDGNSNATGITGLDWGTGAAWLAVGILHLYVTCYIPEANAVYKPPTAGLATLGQQQDSNGVGGLPDYNNSGATNVNPI